MRTCSTTVSNGGPYYFIKCGRPAKWVAVKGEGKPRYACGIHVRWFERNGYTVTPVEKQIKDEDV